MTKQQHIFLDFLRYCISTDVDVPPSLAGVDWRQMYYIADHQALWALTFAGVSRIFEDKKTTVPALPHDLMLKWYAMSEKVRSLNKEMNNYCRIVSERFRAEGFDNCILKGQGLAMLYPDSLNRTSGDIDIWLNGGRKKIMEYIDKVVPGQTVRYHHVDFPVLKDVTIEVHFTPSYMHNPILNSRMQKWFDQVKDKQFSNLVTDKGFAVPHTEFNMVYVLSHLFRHMMSEGFGFRQLLDYYYVLKQGCSDAEKAEVVKTIEHLGMLKFAGGVMYVLKEVFDMDDRFLLVAANEKEGRFLLKEIMIGGNFGKYDSRLGNKQTEGIVRRYFRMTLSSLRLTLRYPSNALCEPIFRTLRAIVKYYYKLLYNIKLLGHRKRKSQ